MFENIRIFSKIKDEIYSKIEKSITNTNFSYKYNHSKEYIIINNDKTEYWNEAYGWTTDINKATKYSEEFQETCYLPIEGEFIEFEKEQ